MRVIEDWIVKQHEVNHVNLEFDPVIGKFIAYTMENPTTRVEGNTEGEAFRNLIMITTEYSQRNNLPQEVR